MAITKIKNTLEAGGAFEALVTEHNTLVTNCNASVGSITGVNAITTDHNLAAADIIALRATILAMQTDIVNLRATVAANVTAMNTLATKLNSDAGVTDTNYATANAAPSAVGSSAPSAITVQGAVAAVTAGGITASNTITLTE